MSAWSVVRARSFMLKTTKLMRTKCEGVRFHVHNILIAFKNKWWDV